jgi:hypothetical protein
MCWCSRGNRGRNQSQVERAGTLSPVRERDAKVPLRRCGVGTTRPTPRSAIELGSGTGFVAPPEMIDVNVPSVASNNTAFATTIGRPAGLQALSTSSGRDEWDTRLVMPSLAVQQTVCRRTLIVHRDRYAGRCRHSIHAFNHQSAARLSV